MCPQHSMAPLSICPQEIKDRAKVFQMLWKWKSLSTQHEWGKGEGRGVTVYLFKSTINMQKSIQCNTEITSKFNGTILIYFIFRGVHLAEKGNVDLW